MGSLPRLAPVVLGCGWLLSCGPEEVTPAPPARVDQGLGLIDPSADLVLGQLDLSHRGINIVDERGLALPGGVAVDLSATPRRLYVADTGNHRVLGWPNIDSFASGDPATLVLGQPDFLQSECRAPSATSLCGPTAVAVDGSGNVYVADTGNHRVLVFHAPFTSDQTADAVLGQPGFTTNAAGTTDSAMREPRGLAFGATSLYVADTGNHRVLRFALPLTSGGGAQQVFGQANMTAGSCNRGGAVADNSLCRPIGVSVSGGGALYVADHVNNRVVAYPAVGTNGPPATVVLGQSSFTAASCNRGQPTAEADRLCGPTGVAARGDDLYVVDSLNGRVLFFQNPLLEGSADRVYGQGDFTADQCNRGGFVIVSADRLCPEDFGFGFPSSAGGAVALDFYGHLWVADVANNRVVRFPAVTTGAIGPAADRVLGQFNLMAGAANGANAQSLWMPSGVALDRSVKPHRAFVADALNHRVLGWSDASALENGAPADLVIGQPDNTSTRCDISAPASADGLCFPAAVAVDADGNLWVAEHFSHRVMRFDRPFEEDRSADIVLGQDNFTSRNCTPGAKALCFPWALAIGPAGHLYVSAITLTLHDGRVQEYAPPFTSGASPGRSFDVTGSYKPAGLAVAADGTLYVSDTAAHRVLVYPGDGMRPDVAANKVLGQADLTGSSCNRGGAPSAATLCFPQGLALSDDGTLYVADNGTSEQRLGNRVLVFENVATKSSGAAADAVLGQVDATQVACNRGGDVRADSLCGAWGLAADSGGSLFVADSGNNRVIVFSANRPPTIEPIADQTVTAGAPVQVVVSASDPNDDDVRLSLRGAPPALAIVDGAISGTPGAADVGVHTVAVEAVDTGTPARSASATFTLTVLGEEGDGGLGDGGMGAGMGGTGDGCGCGVGGTRGGGAAAVVLVMLLGRVAARRRVRRPR